MRDAFFRLASLLMVTGTPGNDSFVRPAAHESPEASEPKVPLRSRAQASWMLVCFLFSFLFFFSVSLEAEIELAVF